MKHQAVCVHVLGFGAPVPKYCPSNSLNMCWTQSKREHKVCFILVPTFRSSRHLYNGIHSIKEGQRFQACFWRGRFFIFGSGSFLVFFLNCLGNRGIPFAKNKQQISLLHQEDPRPFVSASGTKTFKQKSSEKIQEWHPQNWRGRLLDRSMQISFSCLLSLAHFKQSIYIH